MAPSTSSEGMNGDVMQGTPTATPNPGHYVYSHRFEETPSEAYPPPPVEYREILNEHTGVVESASIIQHEASALALVCKDREIGLQPE
ncbi:hypothetical protein Aduo_004605 [Ancylostoma duodenale]